MDHQSQVLGLFSTPEYLLLPPEPVLVALASGWLLPRTAVVEDNGQAGVIAQEVEEPQPHAMGIHNSTAWLSGKAMDTSLSHPLFVIPVQQQLSVAGHGPRYPCLPPPLPDLLPHGWWGVFYTVSFCQFPTASQCSLQQQKRNSCSWLLWFLINWNTFLTWDQTLMNHPLFYTVLETG